MAQTGYKYSHEPKHIQSLASLLAIRFDWRYISSWQRDVDFLKSIMFVRASALVHAEHTERHSHREL